MKNYIRLISAAASAALLLGLSACGSSASYDLARSGSSASYASSDDFAAEEAAAAEYDDSYDYDYEYDYSGEDAGTAVTENKNSALTASDAKLIYTGSISLSSTDFDAARTALDSMVTGYGGYFSSQQVYSEDYWKEAYYTVRLPSENFNSFMNAFSENDLLKVTYQDTSVEDVTEEYTDVENRLETLQIKLDRLNELMKQAEDMEDIITIESEISDVEYEIESYSGTKNHYDSLISYSTVTITLTERESYDEVMEPTLGERIRNAFTSGLENFGVGCADLLVWAVGNILGILVFAVIVAVIVIIVRRSVKKGRERQMNAPAPRMNSVQAPQDASAPQPRAPEEENK